MCTYILMLGGVVKEQSGAAPQSDPAFLFLEISCAA